MMKVEILSKFRQQLLNISAQQEVIKAKVNSIIFLLISTIVLRKLSTPYRSLLKIQKVIMKIIRPKTNNLATENAKSKILQKILISSTGSMIDKI